MEENILWTNDLPIVMIAATHMLRSKNKNRKPKENKEINITHLR
jgi:hypothetical protein